MTDLPPRPARPLLYSENIPAELKPLKRWVGWRYRWDEKTGLWKKPPLRLDGKPAEGASNPDDWGTFDEAFTAYQNGGSFDGLGLVLVKADGLTALDFDKVWDAKSFTFKKSDDEALVRHLNSYTEISPSGEGIRAIAWATIKDKTRSRVGHYEIYDDDRYVTVTGNRLGFAPPTVEHRDIEASAVYAQIFEANLRKALADLTARALFNGDLSSIPRKADGITPDYSIADHRLCQALLRHGDLAAVDRWFHLSKLMRPKWDEMHGVQTYGAQTMEAARRGIKTVSSCPVGLSPAEVLRASEKPMGWFPSTIPAINAVSGGAGYPTGAFVVVLGIPDAGKTGLVIQDAVHIALHHEVVTVLFTPDQGRIATALRVGALLGFNQARLEDRDPVEINRLEAILRDRNIYIVDDEDEGATTENVIAIHVEIHPELPHVLVLDSLQEARAHGDAGEASERDRVIANVRASTKATKTGRWLVLSTSQTTKASQAPDRKNRPALIMSGAESGKIAFAVVIGIFLEGDPAKPPYGYGTVAKSKLRGQKLSFGLTLDRESTRLSEIDAAEATDEREQKKRARDDERIEAMAILILATLEKRGPLSGRGIAEFVGGNHEDRREALNRLEGRKRITVTAGKKGAFIYTAVRREGDL